MRKYELIYIVHPELDETAFNDLVQKVNHWITDSGGTISKVDIWGKRRLAYPIRKQKEGQYVLVYSEMAPAFGSELERNLRFQESILRFSIISVG
jgi:small subunit ribosomal protein S6